jgi:hypothetical protein
MVYPGKGTGHNAFYNNAVLLCRGVDALNLILNVFSGPKRVQEIRHKLNVLQPQIFPYHFGPDFGFRILVDRESQVDAQPVSHGRASLAFMVCNLLYGKSAETARGKTDNSIEPVPKPIGVLEQALGENCQFVISQALTALAIFSWGKKLFQKLKFWNSLHCNRLKIQVAYFHGYHQGCCKTGGGFHIHGFQCA